MTGVHVGDRIQSARADSASAYRRLAASASAAAVTLDDPSSLPDLLDTDIRRVANRTAAARTAHDIHMASRAVRARAAR